MRILLTNAFIDGKKQHLLINNVTIDYIGQNPPEYDRVIDLEGLHLLPGVIDPHVHVRDMGQSYKEDWKSASLAAIYGGVTTIFDMPNTVPPTTNLRNLNEKRKAARKSLVHYKFNVFGTKYNVVDLKEMLENNPGDIAAVKVFLAGSNDSEYVDDIDILKRIFELARLHQLPVMVHSEWQACVEKHASQYPNPSIFEHHLIRNPECAAQATEKIIELTKEIGNKLYIVHTSTAEEIEFIRQNKSKAEIYCEATPHHLFLNINILEKAGNFGKVNPPIREEKHRKGVYEGMFNGIVDTIGTDHAPHTLDEKTRPYPQTPSGFPGLETSLPLLLNEVVEGRLDLKKVKELTATNAARIFGLKNRGRIKEGYMADLVAVDLNKSWKIEPGKFKTKAKYSPFDGMEGKGSPVITFVKGKPYYLKT